MVKKHSLWHQNYPDLLTTLFKFICRCTHVLLKYMQMTKTTIIVFDSIKYLYHGWLTKKNTCIKYPYSHLFKRVNTTTGVKCLYCPTNNGNFIAGCLLMKTIRQQVEKGHDRSLPRLICCGAHSCTNLCPDTDEH